jgi:hypothetical protein
MSVFHPIRTLGRAPLSKDNFNGLFRSRIVSCARFGGIESNENLPSLQHQRGWRITGNRDIEAENDDEALFAVRAMQRPLVTEVWSGDRRICRIPAFAPPQSEAIELGPIVLPKGAAL